MELQSRVLLIIVVKCPHCVNVSKLNLQKQKNVNYLESPIHNMNVQVIN